MGFFENRGRGGGSATQSERSPEGAPGRRTLAEALPEQPVQRRSAGDTSASRQDVREAAARGTSGTGGALPHRDAIQASFGAAFDVSSIRAHEGGAAAEACGDMNAAAFATGQDVAFKGAPDLHTAAHEAAHVVQQAQGVNLYGGVGEAGDAYERHADAVADRVVAGESAADLLGASPAPGAGQTAVQRKEEAAADPELDPLLSGELLNSGQGVD